MKATVDCNNNKAKDSGWSRDEEKEVVIASSSVKKAYLGAGAEEGAVSTVMSFAEALSPSSEGLFPLKNLLWRPLNIYMLVQQCYEPAKLKIALGHRNASLGFDQGCRSWAVARRARGTVH